MDSFLITGTDGLLDQMINLSCFGIYLLMTHNHYNIFIKFQSINNIRKKHFIK